MALNDLAKTAREMAERVTPGDDAARAMSVLLRKITGFSGLVHENMYHFTGWRFLSIGRSLERSIAMSSALAWLADRAGARRRPRPRRRDRRQRHVPPPPLRRHHHAARPWSTSSPSTP